MKIFGVYGDQELVAAKIQVVLADIDDTITTEGRLTAAHIGLWKHWKNVGNQSRSGHRPWPLAGAIYRVSAVDGSLAKWCVLLFI